MRSALLGLTASLHADPSVAWVPLTVLVASLVGSPHCVGMCGGLVISVCRTRVQWVGYQVGRLLSYAALGAGAGTLGHTLLADGIAMRWASWGAAILMAAGFIAMGVRSWKGGAPHFKVIPSSTLSWFYRKAQRAPILLGALSAALPCGWLQSFVLASAATQSTLGGAAMMTVFWIGTLPALSAAPWITHRLLRPIYLRVPKLTAVLLIVAGLGGIGFKMRSLFAADGTPAAHCHDSGSKHADE